MASGLYPSVDLHPILLLARVLLLLGNVRRRAHLHACAASSRASCASSTAFPHMTRHALPFLGAARRSNHLLL